MDVAQRVTYTRHTLMRACFWSTTFQADNHALAHYLANERGWDVTVAMPDPEAFMREPVLSVLPFRGNVLPRDANETRQQLSRELFDLVVLDNHVPNYRCAKRLFVLWHGLGWRVDDLRTMRGELSKLIGDVTEPNPYFRWQAFGEADRAYRITHSKLAPGNVFSLGSPYSDWLLPSSPRRPVLDKRALQKSYSIDLTKPVVLIALTWHHGGSLGHWGDEEQLLTRLVQHVASRGASVLLRMHDRKRYQRAYVRLIERLAARCGDALMLKWKDTSPDSLIDLLLSDVCISNYSSLLNCYYYSERPSIHVEPHDLNAARFATYKMFLGLPLRRTVTSARDVWKLPPEEVGGLRASGFDMLLEQVDRALSDPDCCRELSRAFVARYVFGADGTSCARTANFLEQWLGA